MVLRAALAALSVAALVFGVVHLGAARSCSAAQADPLRSVDALLSDCEGALPLATGSVALVRAGRLEDAGRLADAAVRRQPGDYVSWLAVAGVRTARGDAEGASRARDRATRLNPLR